MRFIIAIPLPAATTQHLTEEERNDLVSYGGDIVRQMVDRDAGSSMLACLLTAPDLYPALETAVFNAITAGFKQGLTKAEMLRQLDELVEDKRQEAILASMPITGPSH